jgi:trehalose utilization protein
MAISRRGFLQTASAAAFANFAFTAAGGDKLSSTVRVLIWDEQQPAQKEAYPNFLGNAIADWLKTRPEIEVRSVRLDDPEQGLKDDDLSWANVIVWWGHVRQAEITPETARKKIVEPILAGKLSLVALHSAHWSTPFMEAMNERTRQDVRKRYPHPMSGALNIEFVPPRGRIAPAADSLVTPAYYALKPDGVVRFVRVDLPNCCFPDYRPDGAPSTVHVLKPDHPIARGLPEEFQIQHTEMYNEPFHVPQPDEVVLRETWAKGESFRSGCVWSLGRGKVFYFRPGHETFSVYLQREPLQIVENAVHWLAACQHEAAQRPQRQ